MAGTALASDDSDSEPGAQQLRGGETGPDLDHRHRLTDPTWTTAITESSNMINLTAIATATVLLELDRKIWTNDPGLHAGLRPR
jgi:hypothetical protein